MIRISCLDVFEENVKSIIQETIPPGVEIAFASSSDEQEQMELASSADVILVGGAPVTAKMIEASPRLKAIQKWGIGTDKIDLSAASYAGVPVSITSGSNAGPVAELAVGLMLAVYRRIPYADRSLRSGRWLKPQMRGLCYQIEGKDIGLFGFGAIGRMVAHRLRGFDANVHYFDKQRADRVTERALGVTFLSFEELIRTSDILSLHAPLNDQTRGIIGADQFDAMKTGSILINTARGGLVDEAALYDALQAGQLRGAGLDSFAVEPLAPDHPFLELDQVVLTPHAGGGVLDNVANVAQHALENIAKTLEGEPLNPADVILAGRRATS